MDPAAPNEPVVAQRPPEAGDLPLEPGVVPSAVPQQPARSGGRSFESRASIALKVVAGFGAVATVLVVLPAVVGNGETLPAIAAGLIAAALLVAVEIVEAIALDRRRAWAVAAARPVLGIVLLVGVANAIAALGQGKITIPLDAILAVWAFLGTSEVARPPALGRRGLATLAAFVLTLLGTVGSGPVLGPGGLFDAQRGDLVTGLDATCTPATGNAAETIDVTYRWSWTRGAPLPSGLDGVVIAWTGFGPPYDQPWALGDVAPTPSGVISGLSGAPSATLVEAAMQAPGAWTWGVQLAEQRYEPGEVHLRLMRAQLAASPGPTQPLTIVATYVHLGAWQHVTELTATCP